MPVHCVASLLAQIKKIAGNVINATHHSIHGASEHQTDVPSVYNVFHAKQKLIPHAIPPSVDAVANLCILDVLHTRKNQTPGAHPAFSVSFVDLSVLTETLFNKNEIPNAVLDGRLLNLKDLHVVPVGNPGSVAVSVPFVKNCIQAMMTKHQ